MKAEFIDKMGTDLTVVNAARVSFDKESEWELVPECCGHGTINGCCLEPYPSEQLAEKDQKLIKYLANHNHWTPFSHVMIQMRETVPIFVARQRFKHMVGFTYNEVSRRYVDDEPKFFLPNEWRKAPANSKQGSDGPLPYHQLEYTDGLKDHHEMCTNYYRWLIDEGVAPEQARMVLPQSMYTSYYVTGSLAAWARAYKLRIDPHAQKEIQDLATQWGEIIGATPELKYSWEALTNKKE